MNRILIQFAHPAYERSTINRTLLGHAARVGGVIVNDLYERYPDFDIDVPREQQLLRDADLIVWQFPTLWYSVPPLLRQWQDDVLEYGFAYGATNALRGKGLLICTSTGGSEPDYAATRLHGAPLNDYIAPWRQLAAFCDLQFLPPYVIYGATAYGSLEDAAPIGEDYARLLVALRDGPQHWGHLADLSCLTGDKVAGHG